MDAPVFSNKQSLAYITNIPTPYRVEMVETWARLNPHLAISVYYTNQDDQGRGWATRPVEGVSEHRLKTFGKLYKYGKLNLGLLDLVRGHDVVMIGGFEEISYLVSAILAKVLGKPVILLVDGFSPARFATEWLTVRWVKKLTATLCDIYFVNGEVSRQYFEQYLRIDKDKPIFNQYLSHSDFFISEARKQLVGVEKRAIQKRLGFDTDRSVLLCCGYLIKRKRIDLVIQAISLLPEHLRPLLLVVGNGPLADYLAKLAVSRSVPIHFVGFKQNVELASCYFAADALVLSSEDDPWGLVVNEAMSAGLPVIVSDACGVALDLVREGQNGFIFHNRDVKALSMVIEQLLDSDMESMGTCSRILIQEWTAEHSAKNLGLCCEAAFRKINKNGFLGVSPENRQCGLQEVIVLHEREGRKYMEALCRLSEKKQLGKIDFFSASVFRKFLWDILIQGRSGHDSFKLAFSNLRFRWSFRQMAGKTVIFGVAPWDYRFLFYQSIRKRNRLIYHTSWPYWEDNFVPRTYGYLTPWMCKLWLAVLQKENVEIVSVTETSALSLGNLLPNKHISVIPHVVSDVFFNCQAKYTKPFRILFVGELTKNKGVFILPLLLDELEKQGEACLLDIVGDGPQRNFVRKLVETRPNVSWHGYVSNRERLAGIMSSSQLLVVTSVKSRNWEELFGMVIAEAMAVGLPVISSKHVGPRTVIEDGVTGYLVSENSKDEYIERIQSLMNNASLWQEFSEVALERSKIYQMANIMHCWHQLILRKTF